MRLRNLTWRVTEANTRVRENHERERAIVHAQDRKQLQVERDLIRSHIHGMAPGVRKVFLAARLEHIKTCLLYTSPSPRDRQKSRMPSSA